MSQNPQVPVQNSFFPLAGGLDLSSPPTMVQPGRCFDAMNYEVDSVNGGYRLILGYERFSGRTRPSDAQYYLIDVSISGTVAVGNTVTGATSAATGKVLQINENELVLGRITGTFLSGEILNVGGSPVATTTSVASRRGASSVLLDATYLALAADDIRTDIAAVPGSGSVLGVWRYNDTVYAFRNNAGGTAAVMHKQSSTGWTAVTLPYEIAYTAGYYPPEVGVTLKGYTSGATATVNRVVNKSGSWGGAAVGVFNVTPVAGTFSASEIIYDKAVTSYVTISIASPAVISWASHGRQIGECVVLTTTGALPTGLAAATPYYIIAAGYGANSFQVSATLGGTAINTSGVQSGTHSAARAFATSITTAVQIALAPSGRYEFVNYGFTGASNSLRMYGCDGKNKAFEFDGTTYVQLRTGMTTDTPKHIAAHKMHLFLSFDGSLQNSSIGDPYGWSVVTGANELGAGDSITALLPQPGDSSTSAMAVFTRHTTQTLYGSSSSDWQLVNSSPTAGIDAYSAQWLNTAMGMSQRGIQQITQTMAFGDFQFASLSGVIQPLINQKRGLTAASAVYKERNQYRVFFTDGSALAVTMLGNKLAGIMPILYPNIPTCYCVQTGSDGKEYCYFGDKDGYVYQDNIGTSFDGESKEFWLRLPFNHLGSPQYRKRFRKATFDAMIDSRSELSISYELNGSDSSVESSGMTAMEMIGGGGYWNQFTWSAFVWDAPVVSQKSLKLYGTGRNLSLLIYGNSAKDGSHAIQGVSLSYTLRRIER